MKYTETLLFPTGERSHYRIPSVITANDGTVLAFCNDRKDTVDDHAEETALVCRRKPLNGEWLVEQVLAAVPGWACTIGSAVCDEQTGTVFCNGRRIPVATYEFGHFTEEEKQAIARRSEQLARDAGVQAGDFLLWSDDQGETWQERPMNIEPYVFVRGDGAKIPTTGFCHGSSHGITLRHGKHRGRLICPARMAVGDYHDLVEIRQCSYNDAVYSDDHGFSWKTSAPVQAGTGEGTLMEDGQGVITYNSRAYYCDQKRYLATSTDGGVTYGDFRTDDFLLEEKRMGCNASLLRVEREELAEASLLPEGADSITVFITPRAETRVNLTACISFDSGKTWVKTRQIWPGKCAYSSLTFCPQDQQFHLLYEKGVNDPYDSGVAAAAFDLAWLLA